MYNIFLIKIQHLMLLLNISGRYAKPKGNGVSIHLMLLLNRLRNQRNDELQLVSIHLMLLLNDYIYVNEFSVNEFQYILCCY